MKRGLKIAAGAAAGGLVAVAIVVLGRWVASPEQDVVDLGQGAASLAPDDNGAKPDGAQEIVFGFDLRASPEEDARQYLPFLKYLEEATGYEFQLRFTPKDGQLSEDLGRGTVQIAAIGAVTLIKAREKFDVRPLVRGLNHQGKAEYQSVIVVAPDSALGSLEDLRDKRIAFGNIDSTQGHIIPRILLKEHGLDLDSFAAYEFTGSHQNCASAVIAGRYDACGMQDTMARILDGEGKVKILETSSFFPSSGIAVNKAMSAEAVEKIKQAMLDFEPTGRHRDILHNWDRTEMPYGFTEASEGDYEALQKSMRDLGLLK